MDKVQQTLSQSAPATFSCHPAEPNCFSCTTLSCRTMNGGTLKTLVFIRLESLYVAIITKWRDFPNMDSWWMGDESVWSQCVSKCYTNLMIPQNYTQKKNTQSMTLVWKCLSTLPLCSCSIMQLTLPVNIQCTNVVRKTWNLLDSKPQTSNIFNGSWAPNVWKQQTIDICFYVVVRLSNRRPSADVEWIHTDPSAVQSVEEY